VSLLSSGSLYFDLRDGLHGLVQANCSTDDGAQQVQGALKALVGLGRLSVPKDQPELAQVYDSIRITEESRRVKMYLDIPQATVDRFLSLWLRQ
jgi:predicted RNA polymerase sigma factor